MKKILSTLVIVLIPLFLLAQTLQEQIDQFMDYYTELLTGLTILWGYAARFIPKLKDAPMKVLNVIAFLIVAGGAFIWMDLATPWQVVVAAFASAGIYSYILKPGTKLFELVSKYLPMLVDLILGGLKRKAVVEPTQPEKVQENANKVVTEANSEAKPEETKEVKTNDNDNK